MVANIWVFISFVYFWKWKLYTEQRASRRNWNCQKHLVHKTFGPVNFWPKKKLGPTQFWVHKILGHWKNFDQKIFWKKFVHKNFGLKIFGQKDFGSKKLVVNTKFESKKNVASKKYGSNLGQNQISIIWEFHYTDTWTNVAGTNVAWSNVPETRHGNNGAA